MQKIQFLILLSFFILIGCSENNEDDISNPPNGTVDPSIAEPTNLWIVNITTAGQGKHIALSKGKKSTFQNGGNAQYRIDLGLDNKVVFSIMGANFNTDGSSSPTKALDMPTPNSLSEKRNNHVVSFVMANESEANAKITINNPFSIDNFSSVNDWGNTIRKIDAGVLTITTLNSHLNDAVPPLGKNKNDQPNTLIKFRDVDGIVTKNYNNLAMALVGTNPDVTFTDIETLFGQQGNEILIRVIEGAIDAGEGQPQLYQP